MVQQITSGISISVETHYQPEHSNPINSEYLFLYKITIENRTTFTVQLLSRRWVITESNGSQRVVEGDGVVGKQPVIETGERYEYVSASAIRTDVGKMVGYYKMQNTDVGAELIIPIPEFQLVPPFKLN